MTVGGAELSLEVTLSRHSSDPSHSESELQRHLYPHTTGTIPTVALETYRPVAEPPVDTDSIGPSRKIKRLTQTREIRIRTTHRRRKYVARGGVLAGFGLAMVVYPLMGNVVQYHSTVSAIPGVVVGESPSTGHALLGDGPRLIPTVLEVPSDKEQTMALAANTEELQISDALPGCVEPASYAGENGMLSADQLCNLWDDFYLRADAAIAFASMNAQFYAEFGRNICLSDTYRSYSEQVAIKAKKGYLAAPPGKSLHGLGLAVDLCRGEYTGAPGDWLDNNAEAYGYWNPTWHKTQVYEPWHWEYKIGVEATGAYDGGGYWAADGAALVDDTGALVSDGATAPSDGATATAQPTAGTP